jgi:hypothetical protein
VERDFLRQSTPAGAQLLDAAPEQVSLPPHHDPHPPDARGRHSLQAALDQGNAPHGGQTVGDLGVRHRSAAPRGKQKRLADHFAARTDAASGPERKVSL